MTEGERCRRDQSRDREKTDRHSEMKKRQNRETEMPAGQGGGIEGERKESTETGGGVTGD